MYRRWQRIGSEKVLCGSVGLCDSREAEKSGGDGDFEALWGRSPGLINPPDTD